MPFFRRSLDPAVATVREATSADAPAVMRLLRESSHRYVSYSSGELPSLIRATATMLLWAGAELWGAAAAGWQIETTLWLRALAMADGVSVGAGLDVLLPPLYERLRAAGASRLFFASDAASDSWLLPGLIARGYAQNTEVVVYEKRSTDVPAAGNPNVLVRAAQPVDLAPVLAIDAASFDVQWMKDESLLGPALVEAPYFVVAEHAGAVCGYAYATVHFGGQLVHLVRIATHPRSRRQGIGVRLLADVIRYARSCGAETVTLNTQVDNLQAQRLYEWFGFRRTTERQIVVCRNL